MERHSTSTNGFPILTPSLHPYLMQFPPPSLLSFTISWPPFLPSTVSNHRRQTGRPLCGRPEGSRKLIFASGALFAWLLWSCARFVRGMQEALFTTRAQLDKCCQHFR